MAMTQRNRDNADREREGVVREKTRPKEKKLLTLEKTE